MSAIRHAWQMAEWSPQAFSALGGAPPLTSHKLEFSLKTPASFPSALSELFFLFSFSFKHGISSCLERSYMKPVFKSRATQTPSFAGTRFATKVLRGMKDFGTLVLGQDCHAIYTLLYIKQAILTSPEALSLGNTQIYLVIRSIIRNFAVASVCCG